MARAAKKTESSFRIHAGEEGRLDRFLVEHYPKWSRTSLQRLINGRHVLIDNHPVSPNHRLQLGQTVTIKWPETKPAVLVQSQEEIPFPIVFEDDTLIAINKPPGIVVHPAAGHKDGNTVVEILRPKISGGPWPEEIRPGLVHRLDRDTSGILLLAKNPQAHQKVSAQFARRQVKKTYKALAKGKVKANHGTLESHLARHPGKRQRFAVSSAAGRWAITQFSVLERMGDLATFLELRPLTGRTHQIRVHLSSYEHPIIGDHVYGVAESAFDFVHRQMLHAFSLEFTHPKTGEVLRLEAPLPADFQEALKLIRLSV